MKKTEAAAMACGQAEPAVTPLTRRIMQRVRSKNSTPELIVRKALHAAGFRFRLHDRRLPGTPDIVMRRHSVAIFVHGCFWHRHSNCRYATMPKTRTSFWEQKFQRNVQRDLATKAALQFSGWRVVEVWECDVKTGAFLPKLLEELS